MPNLLKKKTNKPSESKRKGKNTENILNKLLKNFLIIFLFNKQKKNKKFPIPSRIYQNIQSV
jgi:hypothetical protein